MLKRETIEREAKDKAGQMLFAMTKGLERESGWDGLSKRIMDVAARFMQKVMTDAYFLGLRDAKAAYQELNDFDRFTAAMEKAAEDLTRKEA